MRDDPPLPPPCWYDLLNIAIGTLVTAYYGATNGWEAAFMAWIFSFIAYWIGRNVGALRARR